MPADRIEAILHLGRRRGFLFPSNEIYGGPAEGWDYGHLGVELRENIKRQWWRACVQRRDDVVGMDSAILSCVQVWEATGHPEALAEDVVDCQVCRRRWRATEIATDPTLPPPREDRRRGRQVAGPTCPGCGSHGSLSEPRRVEGMLATTVGCAEEPASARFLRPEAAQGMFVNFANIVAAARRRPPFGVGQMGKTFRQPPAGYRPSGGSTVFGIPEFEQMELGFFVRPGTDRRWHEYWLDERLAWYAGLGIAESDLRRRERASGARAHVSNRTVDIEYRFGHPDREWAAVEEVSNRGDHDLVAHAKNSGAELSYFDQTSGERWTPYVISPAARLTRCMFAFLVGAYSEDVAPNAKGKPERRTVLRLHPKLAPVKVAVLPLSRNAELSPRARAVATTLREQWNVEFDDAGAIGRRYRRQDEIGTPYCITLDFQTLDDGAATVRERDSMAQERVGLDALPAYLGQRLAGC